MKDRAYKVNVASSAMTLEKARIVVERGGIDYFNPTEKQAIAICVTKLAERVRKANKLHREGKKSGYTDQEYDSLEKSLMVYCLDWESCL